MTVIFSGNPLTGTVGNDFILGQDATTLIGGGGADIILGDIGNLFTTYGATRATALNIDDAAYWTRFENPLSPNDTHPHATLIGQPAAGAEMWYAVTIGAGETIIIDADSGIGAIDTMVSLVDSNGNVIAANDDADVAFGGLGSTSRLDTYINRTITTAGTYYIHIYEYYNSTFEGNETFLINVLVTGHATTAGVTANLDDSISGDAGADLLMGGAGDDLVEGGAGADTLSAGSGNDTLMGGADSDSYYIDSLDDLVIETTTLTSLIDAGGNDTIFSSVSLTLDAAITGYQFIEALWLTGTADISGTGNAGANWMRGNAGNNVILGMDGSDDIDSGPGNDLVEGGLGHDYIGGGVGNDTLYGGVGNDYVSGSDGFDLVDGGDGDDHVRGGSEDDTMFGGDGNDSMVAEWGDDLVDAGLGRDTVFGDSGDDTISGGGGNDNLQGGTGNDLIDGGVGNDSLYGSFGDDSLLGGLGNDTLYASDNNDSVDGGGGDDSLDGGSAADSLVGGSGNDFLLGGIGIDTLDGGVDDDTLDGGVDADSLFGGSGNDLLQGNLGTDTLDGGAGGDAMYGGAGSDIYLVDDAGDTVFETYTGPAIPGFNDHVFASVDFSIAASIAGRASIEHLTLTGSADLAGTGNDLANRITGNSGNNALAGGRGMDTLNGGLGDDSLSGGAGRDLLRGGTGLDVLTGGGIAADTFVFDDGDVAQSTVARADRITDFLAGTDRIDLHLIDADRATAGDQAFSFIGSAAFSGAVGELRFETIGGNTFLLGDRNGDSTADMVIQLDGVVVPLVGDLVL